MIVIMNFMDLNKRTTRKTRNIRKIRMLRKALKVLLSKKIISIKEVITTAASNIFDLNEIYSNKE